MFATTHINPSAGTALGLSSGVALNNQALQLEAAGDLQGAERLHLQAIEVKEASLGTDHVTTALSYNGLGELYLTMQRLDKAEEYLDKALRVREHSGPKSDLAVTRDNLAKLYEMKGDVQAAREMRRRGKADNNIACGNYNCPKLSNSTSSLSQCAGCKAVFYCSRPCQVADWKRHKNYCRKSA
ncbi:hypothetical protein K466DRAFT_537921 [Polyporus arcularius HHB13444]|uniref:MYND-type domain-containing protein n=1 Tax=Polyporus arcularius HHB13444 TaxID=1314778 RepID=A0A5C3PUU5_9APHY|nr:hypothetical protein K466DRAFT_537921 [Polyporus arcularius HHB13444]